jgi:hypothetical protein
MMQAASRRSARLFARRHRRGTTTLESLIIVPGFITMFILSTFLGSLYRNKLRTVREAKEAALTAASQSCSGADLDATIEPADGPELALGIIQNAIMGAPWTAVFTRGFSEATEIRTGTATSSATYEGGPLSVTLATRTTMTCNEKAEKVDFLKVFLYAYAKLTPFG